MAREDVLPQLQKLFMERIAYIDGAMGTMIQRYKLEVRAFHQRVGRLYSQGLSIEAMK